MNDLMYIVNFVKSKQTSAVVFKNDNENGTERNSV